MINHFFPDAVCCEAVADATRIILGEKGEFSMMQRTRIDVDAPR